MKYFMSINIFLIIFSGAISNCFAESLDIQNQSHWTNLNEIYFENSRLTRADTYAAFGQVRSGGHWVPGQIEAYAITRMGADSRTILDSSNNIYNDNYVFAGVGIDYLGLLQGVRLGLQIGGSFDLSSKIQEGGFDYRIGTQSYHEIEWVKRNLLSEIYSEALYYRRYNNLLSSVQFRTIYNLFQWNEVGHRIELGPMINLVGSTDLDGLDYNRFIELRMGPRLTFRGPITLSLSPFYTFGSRWERPTTLPTYQDFRVLLTGFISL